MRTILGEIRSGEFAREWDRGRRRWSAERHQLEGAGSHALDRGARPEAARDDERDRIDRSRDGLSVAGFAGADRGTEIWRARVDGPADTGRPTKTPGAPGLIHRRR
jgi:hypothetical protein